MAAIPDHRTSTLTYELQLERDPRWALSEGSRHFEEKSAVFQALHKIATRLNDLGIPYAVVGGMALFQHGLRRFTEDVDILVTKEDLRRIHEKLDGLGYLPPHPRSKHLRDTELGVRIEFLTTGEYPGDGKKKPVVFPEPRPVSFEADGVRYVTLPTLVELKLASGMTNAGRLKDLSDVLELIKLLDLPSGFVDQLNPFVKDKFSELWKLARRRYVTLWQARDAANQRDELHKDGVTLETAEDDHVLLVTTDTAVAKKYDMVEESEYWDDVRDEHDGKNASSESGT